MSFLAASLHVAKQHVNITVQSEPLSIRGFTDIEIHASSPHPQQVIFLNARQIIIDKVTISNKEVPYQYIDSHEALLFKTGPFVRDSSHFASVASIVNESPDLIIPHEGNYPVTVHIEFRVKENSTSIIQKNGIIFTDNTVDGPSGWFPCIDTIAQRSNFQLTVTYDMNLVCVASGELSYNTVDPQKKTTTMQYKIKMPVSASGIGFALGPFMQQPLQSPTSQNRIDNILMYYIGSLDESFRNTLDPVPFVLQRINECFSYDDYFYSSFSFVSLPFLTQPILYPNAVFLPPSINCPLGNLNATYDSVVHVFEAVLGLYIYYLFPVGDPRDTWLQKGLVSYFAEFFANEQFSKQANSFRLNQRWNDLNFLMTEDIFPSIVLNKIDPATGEPFQDEFLRVKAKLLVNMISSSMQNSEGQLILLMRPLLKLCEEQPEFVTTRFFKQLTSFCRTIDFGTFKRQWLSSNGFPIFTYNFTNDTRHNIMKFVLAQTPSCKTNVPVFTGNILVQLRDLEQPYEIPFAVENKIQLQPISYNAHKKKTKKKKFTYVNGTTKDIDVHHAIMWIVLDHKRAWICRVRPRLPQFMILNQLDLLHDVFAQHEAISSLEDFKDTDETIQILSDMLKNDQVYFGVRGHIARALATFNSDQTGDKHMAVLRDWYLSRFTTTGGPNKGLVIKPHDFQKVAQHFVQLEVIKSLSVIRNSENYTPESIVKLLIRILEHANNNSNNMYSDDYFNAEVILAFGRFRNEYDEYYKRTASLITNKLVLHASIPSYRNIITSAGYTALTAIALKTDSFPINIKEMRSVVLKDNNYFDCRASVFRDLLYLCAYNEGVTFAELVSDLKTLTSSNSLEMASMCLREVYRIILNSYRDDDKDHFKSYLLSLPSTMTKEDVISIFTQGDNAEMIAETLWEILTVAAKHHKKLRSEALRAYTTLYGTKLPEPYAKNRNQNSPPVELNAERSNGTLVQIDVKSIKAPIEQPKCAETTS